jgi:hypothetical protein
MQQLQATWRRNGMAYEIANALIKPPDFGIS